MSEQVVDAFESKFNQVRADKEGSTEKKETKYSENNYLDTRLKDGENEKEFQIRILSIDADSKDFFEETYIHWDAKVKKSYVCAKETKNLPEGTSKECPYCDLKEGYWEEYNKATDSDVKKSLLKNINEYKPMNNYVFRVIDRSDEDYGPKFWRVSESVLESIHTLNKQAKRDDINIFDYENGKDLYITYKKKEGKTKFLSAAAAGKQTPVSKDPNLTKVWVSDNKKWTDVYSVKPFEYLEVIISGGTPWFDKLSGKYVDKRDIDKKKAEEEKEREKKSDYTPPVDVNSGGAPQADDLPF